FRARRVVPERRPRRRRLDGAPLQPVARHVPTRRQRRRELPGSCGEETGMSVGAVLFDLDGTLVDSAPDLVGVLNRLLAEDGRPPMPYAIARNAVSDGAAGLIRLGFGHDLPAAHYDALRQRFLKVYAEAVCVNSRPFLSLDEIIHAISNCAWGVVTNKPHAMTVPLLARLGLTDGCGCIVSGDRLPQKKPHPAPLLAAAEE